MDNLFKNIMTVEKVKNAIYMYGYYPALFYLKQLQEDEEYDKCIIVKKALDEVGKGREWYLSTKLDDENLTDTYNKILQGMNNPELINENMPNYIDKFIEELEC